MNLFDSIERRGKGQFSWGRLDCAQFCAGVLQDVTGVDYRSRIPPYGGKRDALRLISEKGGMIGAVSSVLGEPVAVNKLRRGDLALVDVGNGDAVGVVVGTKVAIKDKSGLVYCSIERASMGWCTDG